MSEVEAEACFVLPLREAAAHFACRNARSAEAEMGGFKDGKTHSSIDISTDSGTGFLPFFIKQGGKVLQQNVGFFAEETIRRHHKRGKVPTLLEATRLKVFLLFLAFMGC
jgi:hypothetical protein